MWQENKRTFEAPPSFQNVQKIFGFVSAPLKLCRARFKFFKTRPLVEFLAENAFCVEYTHSTKIIIIRIF